MPPNWPQGKNCTEDEAPLRRKPVAETGSIAGGPVPRFRECSSQQAWWAGDRKILDYAAAHDFILISTDSDFEGLFRKISGAKLVILGACDYPTDVAAEVLRRNAIRIAELSHSQDGLIFLDP
jgi:predicted nuclease of predicted toxin-antitoxin system